MNEANAWWRNLSNNQMKTLEKKYFPTWRSGTQNHMIQEMWENEGKPEPQELIPVLPEPDVTDTRLSTVDMTRPLDPVEVWMANENLRKVAELIDLTPIAAVETVTKNLREQGYLRIAAAVENYYKPMTPA